MAGTYKGDSPGKKITRARLWLQAANWMHALGVPYRGALVLTGHGGDLGALEGLGFKPHSISAVDRVPELTARARKDYPHAYLATGEVGEVAATRIYNSTHLDFCNGINVENLLTVAKVVRAVDTLPAWVGVTMLKGREQPEDKARLVPDLPRSDRKRLRAQLREDDMEIAAELVTHGQLDHRKLRALSCARMRRIFVDSHPPDETAQRIFKPCGRPTSLGSAMSRVDLLRQAVGLLVRDDQIRLRPVVVYAYHSAEHRGAGAGTPFFTVGYIAHHESQAEELAQAVLDLHAMIRYEQLDTEIGLRGVKHTALDLANGYNVHEVAKIFGVPPGTVSAWKAHDSMGNYSEEMREMAAHSVGFTMLGRPSLSDLGWGRTAGNNGTRNSDEVVELMRRKLADRIAGAPRHQPPLRLIR